MTRRCPTRVSLTPSRFRMALCLVRPGARRIVRADTSWLWSNNAITNLLQKMQRRQRRFESLSHAKRCHTQAEVTCRTLSSRNYECRV